MTVATLEELGELVQGTIRGQANIPIRFALPLNDTLPADCITLVDRVNAASALVDSAAAAAIVPAGFPATDKPVIEVTQPHAAFERIIEHLRPHGIRLGTGVDEHAFVHPTARLGRGCIIEAGACVGAHCVLGDRVVLHSGVHIMASSTLGDDCEIFPGAIIYPETQIGSRVVIHGAAVLGAYGFGYKTINGRHARSAQLGWVEIADDVEIGAGVTIDRGTYGATRVGQGTKIDNQVMIGHNCQIGQHNLICAQVGIAGSCSTGDYVVLAGQVGIKDHTHVGNRVMVAAQSGVMHDIPDGEVYSGVPAIPIKKHLHQVALQARLPDIRREIRDLETLSASLQQQLADVQSQINRVTSSNSEQRAA